MDRIAAFRKHWRKHPPVHVLAAAYLGYKPPHEAAPMHVVNNLPEYEE